MCQITQMPNLLLTEVVARGCSLKKLLLKACVGVCARVRKFIGKKNPAQVNFCGIFFITFFTEHLRATVFILTYISCTEIFIRFYFSVYLGVFLPYVTIKITLSIISSQFLSLLSFYFNWLLLALNCPAIYNRNRFIKIDERLFISLFC